MSCETDESDTYFDSLCVSYNDSQTFEDVFAYSVEPVLFHTSDGKSYLYSQELLENSYKRITVYRFAGGKAEKVGIFAGGFGRGVSESDVFGLLPTDPDRFVIESETELLSTAVGRRIFRIGADGMPETDDELYTLAQPVALTLLHSLNVKTLGADGVQKDWDAVEFREELGAAAEPGGRSARGQDQYRIGNRIHFFAPCPFAGLPFGRIFCR